MGIITIVIVWLIAFIAVMCVRRTSIAREKHTYYRNRNNGKRYRKVRDCTIILDEKCLDGVIYIQTGKVIYVREKSDFNNHFEQINNKEDDKNKPTI